MEIVQYSMYFQKDICFLVSSSSERVIVSCNHGPMNKSELFTELDYKRCFENLVLFCLTSMNIASTRPVPIQIKTSFKNLISILRICDKIGYENLTEELKFSLLLQLHVTINDWLLYAQFISSLEVDYVCESTIAFLCIFNSLKFHFLPK